MEMFNSSFPNKMSATFLQCMSVSFVHYPMPRNIQQETVL